MKIIHRMEFGITKWLFFLKIGVKTIIQLKLEGEKGKIKNKMR